MHCNEVKSPEVNDIFFNQYGRIRSGWRFLFFLIFFFLLSAILGGAFAFILIKLPIGFSENSLLARIFGSTIGLVTALFLGWLCGKYFEGLPFRALGAWFTKNWFKDLALGVLFGALAIGVAILFSVAFGNLSFSFNSEAGSSAILITLAMSLVIFVFGAAFEEAFARGYIFQTFTRANLGWLAIVITSLLFASGHLGNPSVNWFSFTNTALAGVWLGAAYLKTRTLWLAFGLHFAWNWVQGAFFGIEVSGLTNLTPAPLFTEIDSGPKWITGGDYGLEGGIACTVALVLSTIAIWFLPILKSTDEMLALTSKEIPAETLIAKQS